ncbi:MAG: hypothetical protein RLZZ293_264 [Pseudomonadota bacterium]|jgi:DNA-binding MarR family transcriptional regulator
MLKSMLNNSIFRDIDNLAKHINNIYETIFRHYGLHRGQFAFLSRIVENKHISLKQLSITLRVDKTTVTKATQKLEASGYINKQVDTQDHRLIHLIATQRGINLYQNIINQKNQIIDDVITNFAPNQIEQFTQMLKQIHLHLEQQNPHYEK